MKSREEPRNFPGRGHMNWLVWRDGKRMGPLPDAELRALIQSGDIRATHAVCYEGSSTWMPIGRVPDLAKYLPSSSPEVRQADGPARRDSESAQVGADRETSGLAGLPALEPSESRPPTSSPRDEPVEERTSGPSHYIQRHWRGELPLTTSYWLNGALLSLLLLAIALVLRFLVDFPSAPRFWSAAMIALWILAVAAIGWQAIGVWRSAGRHVARGGARRWAIVARAAVVVMIVQLGVLVVTQAVPQVREFATMLAGRDPIHGYEIRLLRGGSDLEVSGYIAFGLTGRVATVLDANPHVTVIHLNSGGGRVAEARKLRDLIAARHLSTYTSRQCMSACVIPFLAGERRMIAPGAKIGFHQYTFAGKASAQTLRDMEREKQYFASRGVSTAFVARAFQATSTLWYPAPDEMLAAGFITGYADTGEVALSGMSMGEIDKLDETLRNDPLYSAIEQFEPDAYQQIMKDVKQGFRRGESMADLRTRTMPVVHQLYRKRLAFASDEAIVAFARLMVDEIEMVRDDPVRCAAFLAPGEEPGPDIRVLLGKDLVQREAEVMAEVIRSAASGSWRPPDEAEAQHIVPDVTDRLLERLGWEDLQVLASVGRPGGDPARKCDVCYRYYKEMADMPLQTAGPMLRYTFAKARN